MEPNPEMLLAVTESADWWTQLKPGTCPRVGWTADGILGSENFLCKGSAMQGSKAVQVPEDQDGGSQREHRQMR